MKWGSPFRFCQPWNLAISCLWGWESEMRKWVQWCRREGRTRICQWLLPHWSPEAPPSHWPLSLIMRWLSGQQYFYKAFRTVTTVDRCSVNVYPCPCGQPPGELEMLLPLLMFLSVAAAQLAQYSRHPAQSSPTPSSRSQHWSEQSSLEVYK